MRKALNQPCGLSWHHNPISSSTGVGQRPALVTLWSFTPRGPWALRAFTEGSFSTLLRPGISLLSFYLFVLLLMVVVALIWLLDQKYKIQLYLSKVLINILVTLVFFFLMFFMNFSIYCRFFIFSRVYQQTIVSFSKRTYMHIVNAYFFFWPLLLVEYDH